MRTTTVFAAAVTIAATASGCKTLESTPAAESEIAKSASAGFDTFDRRMTCLHHRRERAYGKELERGFHLKIQGCLHGQMTVAPALAKDRRIGAFEAAEHEVWVRLTSINKMNDAEPDLRGLALKVLGVPGTKLLRGDPNDGQDFLMNDTRVHFLNSPVDVVRASEIADGAKIDPARDAQVIEALQTRARAQLGTPKTMLARQYHSRAPYAFGDAYIIRFFVETCTPTEDRQFSDPTGSLPSGSDHLKPDLVARAASDDGICMLLRAQFRAKKGSERWLDDYITAWEDEPVTLAKLVFPKQDIEAHSAFCEGLDFNPFHSIATHEPVGFMNRGREYIYKASNAAAGRRASIDDYRCSEIFPDFETTPRR